MLLNRYYKRFSSVVFTQYTPWTNLSSNCRRAVVEFLRFFVFGESKCALRLFTSVTRGLTLLSTFPEPRRRGARTGISKSIKRATSYLVCLRYLHLHMCAVLMTSERQVVLVCLNCVRERLTK